MNEEKSGPKGPYILDIKGNSLDDGPGIRSVVFFKGCPLSCVWCHNPESKKAGQEISFDPGTCIGCGNCRDICPREAISPQNPFWIDREKCDLCFLCAAHCPSGAISKVGELMTVPEILDRILPDKPFFDNSGGGVTLSGGEPLVFMDFTSRLLQSLKDNGMNTLVETCGFFDLQRFLQEVYPFVDIIYFDVKIVDHTRHWEFCGISNTRILQNLQELASRAKGDDKEFLPRIPLVPGITDTRDNLRDIASFLVWLGIEEAALMEYNPLWPEKCHKIGEEPQLKLSGELSGFPEKYRIEACSSLFQEAGLNVL